MSPENPHHCADELAAARAELTRLEKQEQQLLQHLLDVRAALKTQRSKIDALIRERNCTISRLPTELLVRIFSYFLSDYLDLVHPRRRLLASVSRCWRDVILDSPMLWEYIALSPFDDFFSLKTQLEKSRDVLLDVVITGWSNWHVDDMKEPLDIIINSADRWRSLTIGANAARCTALIIAEINKNKFPSLQHVVVEGLGALVLADNPPIPRFLSSTSSPALEDLSIGSFTAPPGFLPPSKLKALQLTFQNDAHLRLFPPICVSSSQSLTILSLSGSTNNWLLERDCVTFPALRSLVLSVTEPRYIVAAIVTPMLESFSYSSKDVDVSDSVVFGGLGNKFNTVRRLSFGFHNDFRRFDHACGVALCQAFCDARTVEIKADDVHSLFSSDALGPLGPQCYPLDNFNDLESIAVSCSDSKWLEPEGLGGLDSFVEWLTNRIESGRGRLRVKLKDITYVALEDKFTALYNQLRRCCILELNDIMIAPMMCFSTSDHFPFQMTISHVTSEFMDDMKLAFLTGGVFHGTDC